MKNIDIENLKFSIRYSEYELHYEPLSIDGKRLYIKAYLEKQGIEIEKDNLLKLLNYDKLSLAVVDIIFKKHFTFN